MVRPCLLPVSTFCTRLLTNRFDLLLQSASRRRLAHRWCHFFCSAQPPRGPAVDVQWSAIGLRDVEDHLTAIASWLDAVELHESDPGNVEMNQPIPKLLPLGTSWTLTVPCGLTDIFSSARICLRRIFQSFSSHRVGTNWANFATTTGNSLRRKCDHRRFPRAWANRLRRVCWPSGTPPDPARGYAAVGSKYFPGRDAPWEV